MVRNSLSERRQIGLDFFGFLKETDRASIVNRLELREIYNQKFKTRDAELKYPNFGSVLYALKVSGKITRRKDNIYFSSAVRELYVDQWQRPRRRQPQPVQNGAAGPGPVQNGAAGPGPVQVTSAEGAETGVRDRRKLASLLISELKTHRALFISDKHGVSITAEEPFEDGRLQLWVEDTHVDEYVVKLTVNNTRTTAVHFTYYTSLQWLGYLTLRDESKVTKKNPLSLQPGDSYEIQVCFSCKMVGFYPATLAFEFKPDLNDSDAFHIVRFFEARCVTALGRELAPVAPYKPLSLPAWTPEVKCMIVDGQPPEGLSVLRLRNVVPLRDYKIPLYMNELIKLLKQPAGVSGRRMALLESPLSWENYCEKFHLLLFLEELQMEVDIKRYNIPNNDKEYATMVRDPANKKLLILEVPGVSENRPSVLRGDKLLVCPLGETGVKYCGYVHSVQLDCVKLGFDSKLLDLFVDNMKFKVEFTVNRLTLRLQHRAVDLAIEKRLENVLFPAAPSYFPPPTELPKLRLFDSKLERNPEQLHAVQRIVAGSSKPAPYLVFGPPGTGKTVTLVEAIKQIEKTQASCHILACAPSNSAADLLCTKILEHVDQHKVHRMYASSRDPQLVPKNLKECSNLEGDHYVFAPKEKLMEYRIMVTTLITAGRLVTGGILEGHYTHVFVDEAGHAVETECLIPLAGLLHAESGQVVLAGDPKQLGPILRSPFALKYGMGVSFLERMMNDIPLYQKDQEDGFNSRFVTKLLRNYRSHPAILKVPNELFYDNKLQACADEIKRNSYCRWEHLKKKDFPLILHNVTGIDEREASSPSFFNVAEVEVLMNYVRKLLETGGKKGLATILPKDIGIIAPYRKQVQKIRKFLEKVGKDLKLKDINDLKVGSVEEFQGQERRVILVSTVRSNTKYADLDRKFSLGFVKNEKRFNVAVTRAQALLIVVGNTRVLKTDTTWNRFIQYCREEGGYIDFGADDDDDEENMIERFASLYLDIKPEVETAESAIQQSLHPEWRNDL
uniref:putative helicase mov-10-B.1 n=1 Tax=Monopterus albus TaxID=43700 RepID=UPI0009B363BE|nr:putative helicase mov-10-B.1 [Monopterus albus]